jgi:hypothetical protein
MKTVLLKPLVLSALFIAAAATAQDMPDVGFKSVGRGWPLAASVHNRPIVGPAWVGGAFARRGPSPDQKLDGSRTAPEGIKPLAVDIFTSKDFYKDKALWTDKRYYRCNSPQASEVQRGILSPNPLNTGKDEDAPWGHCDRDLPREAIVSPYPFKSAQAHYEALLKETRQRGGPSVYTFKDFPAAEWNGVYGPPFRAVRGGTPEQQNWYWGAHTQIATIVSLLKPEYQQRTVQEAYHQMRGQAMWPSTFCWPEGFMRRWYPAAVAEHYVVATPGFVQVRTGRIENFDQDVHIGRQFDMTDVAAGGVPRLGPPVPRWYGETIGFWDKDVLITWTSNIQGWKSHSEFEFSNKMQSVEMYTPIRENGKFIGLNHEAIMYDDEALVQPIRIVRNFIKINEYVDKAETPFVSSHCIQTIYLKDGVNEPLVPGAKIEFEMPDMFGRPWAHVWEEYFEKGMSKPEPEDIFDFSKK